MKLAGKVGLAALRYAETFAALGFDAHRFTMLALRAPYGVVRPFGTHRTRFISGFKSPPALLKKPAQEGRLF